LHVIVGLGNPGAEYQATRHNVGQWVIQWASKDWVIPLVPQQFGKVGTGQLGLHPVMLVIPSSWMNLTGEVVARLLESLHQDVSHLLVVHDDLDLPVGRLRVKSGGGSGGHNGLRSLDACLGTNAYGRVKIGIGRPAPGQDTADFVLSQVFPEDFPVMENVVHRAVMALESIVTEGITVAMNHFNQRDSE